MLENLKLSSGTLKLSHSHTISLEKFSPFTVSDTVVKLEITWPFPIPYRREFHHEIFILVHFPNHMILLPTKCTNRLIFLRKSVLFLPCRPLRLTGCGLVGSLKALLSLTAKVTSDTLLVRPQKPNYFWSSFRKERQNCAAFSHCESVKQSGCVRPRWLAAQDRNFAN